MNKFDQTYHKIIRSIQRNQLLDSIFQSAETLGDVICESILPSLYLLINDIIQRLKNNQKSFKYNKNDLKKLSDKDWKYFNLIDKLPNHFSLTIQNCEQYQLKKKYPYIDLNSLMMEFCSDENNFEQHIWIGNYFKEYDEQFKNLLKHQLGRVWTFIFGSLDDNFNDGQGPFDQKILNPDKFNHFQNDVYIHLYNSNLKALAFDYNYVLNKNKDENSNFQLPVHIDNIIEILVADYLENHNDIDTQTYLNNLFLTIKSRKSFSNLTLLKHYKYNKLFHGYSNVDSIKNPIRRLFLIFAFGNDEQIQYFKNATIEQLGKLK